jgi:hypothetical protein
MFAELEAMLIMCGGVDPPDVRKPGTGRRDNDESDGEDSDDSTRMRRAKPATRQGNLRQTRKAADDSDSELDI